MRVRMSKQARSDVLAAVQWWRSNVGNAPTHFLAALHHAHERLAATARVGVPVPDDVLGGLRRLALVRSRYFLFYEVDEARGEVMVLRVWHMSRGRPPKLPKR